MFRSLFCPLKVSKWALISLFMRSLGLTRLQLQTLIFCEVWSGTAGNVRSGQSVCLGALPFSRVEAPADTLHVKQSCAVRCSQGRGGKRGRYKKTRLQAQCCTETLPESVTNQLRQKQEVGLTGVLKRQRGSRYRGLRCAWCAWLKSTKQNWG